MEAPPPTEARPAASSPLRLFRSRSYGGLWTGSTASTFGASVAAVAFAWLVYATTHEALAITLLGISNFAPGLVVGLLAGALADRYERRRLMIVADVLRAVAVGGLVLFLLLRGFDLLVVLTIAAVVSALGALFRPASNALLPQILPGEDLADANGFLIAGQTASQFVGSAVGGLLIVAVGAATDFSLNALTYVLSAAMIAFVVLPPAPRPARPLTSTAPGAAPSLLGEVGEGLRYVRGQPALLYTILSSLGSNFFMAIYGTYEVVYALSFLGAGPAVYGVLAAMNGIGFGLGSLLAGRIGAVRRAGIVLVASWSVGAGLVAELGLVRSIPNALVVFVVVGALLGLGNTAYLACVQQVVPEALLGRFFSVDEVVSFAIIPLGTIAGGLLLTTIGIGPTYVLCGVGGFACTVPLALSRSVRRLAYPPRNA